MTNKEAVKIIKSSMLMHSYRYSTEELEAAFVLAIKALEEQRPQGEWIKKSNGKTTDLYICSVCRRSIMLCKDADMTKYPFCNCGADMRGEEE